MTNPIIQRCCIKVTGSLVSPLLAGSGHSEDSDYDVIRDAYGNPYVPGSSLAGIFRHYLLARFGEGKRQNVFSLFGSNEVPFRKSRLHCYHLKFTEQILSRRDGVKLDAFKTAEKQGKYTFQIVERGAQFDFRLEWIVRAENEKDAAMEEALICELIDGLVDGSLTIGAKSNRGFGQLHVEQVSWRAFNHRNPNDSREWLDWHWCCFDHWIKWEPGKSALLNASRSGSVEPALSYHELRVPLSMKGTIMIRQYVVKDLQEDETNPDYEQMKFMNQPIIPGTTWAGAIRHHLGALFEELGIAREEAMRKLTVLFGSKMDRKLKGVKQQPGVASRLRIAESVVEGGAELQTTRAAIDRFTGGTVSGALFTSKPWVGGTTELTIRWQDTEDISNDAICGLLLWVIRDLQDGLLAIGGETAIGRGIMEACGQVQFDGKPIDQEHLYYKEALAWCQKLAEHPPKEVRS